MQSFQKAERSLVPKRAQSLCEKNRHEARQQKIGWEDTWRLCSKATDIGQHSDQYLPSAYSVQGNHARINSSNTKLNAEDQDCLKSAKIL